MLETRIRIYLNLSLSTQVSEILKMTINCWLSEFFRNCMSRVAGQSEDGIRLMRIKQVRALYERPQGRFELWEKHRKVVDSLAPHVDGSQRRAQLETISQEKPKSKIETREHKTQAQAAAPAAPANHKKRTQTQQTIVLFKSAEDQSNIKARITNTRLESLESYLEKARAKA